MVSPRIPSSSSVASSTAHCVSTPLRPTWEPISKAMALNGAYLAIPVVVSSSAKPRSAPSAASAAICTGSSFRFVICAWLPGTFLARIFCMPIIISTTFRQLMTSAIFAGVMPDITFNTSCLETWISTTILAISRESIAMDTSAWDKLMA